MGYINFRVEKIKGGAMMGRVRMHNQRIAYCENTDAARRFMNRQIMDCAPDYEEFYKKRIEASPVYTDSKKPRADAVHALDLEFRVSAEEMSENPFFDIDKFCDETRRWVCNTFGADNVVDMVLHMDEGYGMQNGEMKFAPHIHAIVVPMTKDGRLSASEYIGSPQKLKDIQTSVAKQFEPMKLKRGLEGSVATHVAMKDYYGWVNAARVVDLPEPGEHEPARQYAARIKPEIQKMQSQHLNDILKLQRARDEALTIVNQLRSGKDIEREELEKAKAELEKREKEYREQAAQFQKDYKALRDWQDVLRGLAQVSADEKAAFLEVAGKALDLGREAREAEEREREESTMAQPGTSNVQK